MKKILCLSTGMSSGGAERQLATLAILLKEKGYEVEVAWYYKSDFFQPYLEKNGVKCKHIFSTGYTRQIAAVRKEIKEYAPDVVIAYMEGPSFICSLIKLLRGGFFLIVSERNVTEVLNLKRKIRFFLYRWADAIVPNSHTQEKLIISNYPKLADKIETITNYTDLEFFKPCNKDTNNDIVQIIVVSRINAKKNTHRFVEAIRILISKYNKSNFVVNWYGNPLDSPYCLKCKEFLEEHDLLPYVHFHTSTKDILTEFQKSDVFCLPSTSEGFPNALSEAMCCGLPVLAGNVCDNPFIIDEGVNGFMFDPYDPNDIARVIYNMLTLSKDDRQKMGIKSRTKAEDLFNKEKFVQQYINLLDK